MLFYECDNINDNILEKLTFVADVHDYNARSRNQFYGPSFVIFSIDKRRPFLQILNKFITEGKF